METCGGCHDYGKKYCIGCDENIKQLKEDIEYLKTILSSMRDTLCEITAKTEGTIFMLDQLEILDPIAQDTKEEEI